ncbi:MAG: hypothetical protein OEY51_06250 [Cyclobacteriaceae bacterium]|nr:hypothetical protein [Cyclobacteriaceae bacterium]
MKIQTKEWLRNYFENKKEFFKEDHYLKAIRRGQHPDQTLYHIIQPTGLMYGYPVKNINGDDIEEDIRIKLLLVDTMVKSYMATVENVKDSEELLEDSVNKTIMELGRFYNAVYSELYTSSTSFFGKKRDDYEVVQRILNKRIDYTGENNFWISFFHNILLFLDIYLFRQWLQTGHDKIVINFLKEQKEELRFTVAKIMASAAHANQVIENEERKLFGYFLDSLNLSSDRKKEAVSFLENGIRLEDISVSDDHWILKKYFLELAILTTWADKVIEDIELEFLKELNAKFGFGEHEFESSMLALEGFVLEFWDELELLQDRQNFERVSRHFISRLQKIILDNKLSLFAEVKSRGPLLDLIRKAKVNTISNEEVEFIKSELIESMERLPSFHIISLPRNFLSLKVLMQVLPDDFFKSI